MSRVIIFCNRSNGVVVPRTLVRAAKRQKAAVDKDIKVFTDSEEYLEAIKSLTPGDIVIVEANGLAAGSSSASSELIETIPVGVKIVLFAGNVDSIADAYKILKSSGRDNSSLLYAFPKVQEDFKDLTVKCSTVARSRNNIFGSIGLYENISQCLAAIGRQEIDKKSRRASLDLSSPRALLGQTLGDSSRTLPEVSTGAGAVASGSGSGAEGGRSSGTTLDDILTNKPHDDDRDAILSSLGVLCFSPERSSFLTRRSSSRYDSGVFISTPAGLVEFPKKEDVLSPSRCKK